MRTLKVISTFAIVTALFVSSASAGQIGQQHTLAANRLAKNFNPSAELFTHQASGIQFDVPTGWKAEPDGDQLTVSSPDDTFTVVFWVSEADEIEAAAEALDEELGKTIKKLKASGAVKKGTHNGMPHFSQDGTGEVEGVAIVWSVDLLMAKKPVIILTFAAAEFFTKHFNAYKKLAVSIKRIK